MSAVNLSLSQIETISMESYQKAIFDFAEHLGMSRSAAKNFIKDYCEDNVTTIARPSMRRYTPINITSKF